MNPGTQLFVIAPVGAVTSFAGYIKSPSSYSAYGPPGEDRYNTEPIPEGFGLDAEALGWMVCDGRQLDASEYPALFQSIGFLYNQRGDSFRPGERSMPDRGVLFRIPDYRGYFLRMVSGVAPWPAHNEENPDPDANLRVQLYYGESSTGVGSIQTDAMAEHVHPFPGQQTQFTGVEPGGGQGMMSVHQNQETSGAASMDGSRLSVSRENRPKNMYVYYLIRVV